jgi:hypothetical protein
LELEKGILCEQWDNQSRVGRGRKQRATDKLAAKKLLTRATERALFLLTNMPKIKRISRPIRQIRNHSRMNWFSSLSGRKI